MRRGPPAPDNRFLHRACRSLALVLTLAVFAECGTPPPPVVDFASVQREYSASDYSAVYQRWTRHENIVRDVESALEVWATFKTADYREAFVAHYAEAYALAPADRDRLMQAQRELAATSYEFLVTAQSSNYRWNDLEKKSSPWRVTLVDGAAHEIAPEQLKVEKLPDIFEREFFPVKTPFTKTYLARFARVTSGDDDFAGERTGTVILRFAGPLGHADLKWTSRGP